MNKKSKSSKTLKEKVTFFLKRRKHLYIIPLSFIAFSILLLIFANFLYERYLVPDDTEEITMDFSDTSSYEFNGETIVVDPGHGGDDPGAPSVSGLTEDEIVYSIADDLKEKLEAKGADVIITRNADEYVTLDERNIDGDLFVSLHSDAIEDPSISGFTTYYTHPEQAAFAETLNQALDEASYFYNRGVNQENFQVTRQIDYPGVLVELGYLSNELDDRIISNERYQDLMADALAEGIYQYLQEQG